MQTLARGNNRNLAMVGIIILTNKTKTNKCNLRWWDNSRKINKRKTKQKTMVV
jgi:hypothetical protein